MPRVRVRNGADVKVIATALTLAGYLLLVAVLELVLLPHRVILRALGGGQ